MALATTLGLILGGVGTAANLFGQSRARKDAAAAQRKNLERDAWSQLMQAARGAVPQSGASVQPLPQVDYGGALQQLGSLALGYGQQQAAGQQRAFENKLETDKAEQAREAAAATQAFREAAQAETARHNQAVEGLRKLQLEQPAAGRSVPFGFLRDAALPGSEDPTQAFIRQKLGLPAASDVYSPELQAWAAQQLRSMGVPLAGGTPAGGASGPIPGFTPMGR